MDSPTTPDEGALAADAASVRTTPGATSTMRIAVEEWVPGLLLAVIVLITISAVAMRYVFRAPLIWANEAAVLLFVWVIFLGSAGALRHGRHLAVDLVPTRVSPSIRAVIALMASVFTLALTIVVTVLAWDFAMRSSKTLESLGLSYLWVDLAVPTGFALLVLEQAVVVARSFLRVVRLPPT